MNGFVPCVKTVEIVQEYVIDPVADLRPICPNCHAMINRSTKMLTIENLKKLIHKDVSRIKTAARRNGAVSRIQRGTGI